LELPGLAAGSAERAVGLEIPQPALGRVEDDASLPPHPGAIRADDFDVADAGDRPGLVARRGSELAADYVAVGLEGGERGKANAAVWPLAERCITHNPVVEATLGFAAELERRDEELARSLADVERIQADVDELRRHADATRAFLDELPELIAHREGDEQAAAAARADAEAQVAAADEALARARKDDQRLEAERQRQQALAAMSDAERWLAQARSELEVARAQGEQHRADAEHLSGRAGELAPRVRDVPPPENGLPGALDWASRARGALLLERSNLVREREAVIRDANELTASVLGEPLVSSAVAGLRDRLALALGESSP